MNKIAIIGAGDIVQKRLKPALEKINYEVFLYSNDESENVNFIDKDGKWLENFDCQIVWIATPSFVHLEYLEIMTKLDKFIIMEKPITCKKEEILKIKNIIEKYNRDKIFFTSYYLLEKALPLYYLQNNNKAYLKYFDMFRNNESCLFDVNIIRQELGKLLSINISIIEGIDNRDWVYLSENGGQFLETFLHNLLVATQFVSSPGEWTDVKYLYGDYKIFKKEKSPNIINILAKDNDIKINLLMAKNQDKHLLERYAYLNFENGTIYINFDTQILEINNEYLIKVKDFYKNIKYLMQIDLALRCFDNEIETSKVDSFVNQLELIEWLLDAQKHTPDKEINKLSEL